MGDERVVGRLGSGRLRRVDGEAAVNGSVPCEDISAPCRATFAVVGKPDRPA